MSSPNYQPILDSLTRLRTVKEGVKAFIADLQTRIANAGTLEEAQEIAASFNAESDDFATAIQTGTGAPA